MKIVKCISILILVITFSQSVAAAELEAKPPTNYTASDFSKSDLDCSGLSEEQQKKVMYLLNNFNCTCGCTKGSWANCIKTDKKCPFNRKMGARVVRLIKAGKSNDYIMGLFDGFKIGSDRRNKKKDDPNKIYPVTTMNAPSRGPEGAPITMIEYTDYQCPYCKKVQPTINALLESYPDKIRYYTMNNPLSFHKRALAAAMTARAAGRQGKFWEMHHLLFENTKALNDEDLVNYAEKLELDLEKFNKDRNDEKLKGVILKEQAQAVKNRATGTPAFFINGKKLSGAKPLDAFKKAIEDALKPKAKGADSKKR